MLRKTFIVVAASAIMLSAAACNTIKGAGRDITSVGQATQDAINK